MLLHDNVSMSVGHVVSVGHVDDVLTDHAVEESHAIDWDKAKMVDRQAQRQTR